MNFTERIRRDLLPINCNIIVELINSDIDFAPTTTLPTTTTTTAFPTSTTSSTTTSTTTFTTTSTTFTTTTSSSTTTTSTTTLTTTTTTSTTTTTTTTTTACPECPVILTMVQNTRTQVRMTGDFNCLSVPTFTFTTNNGANLLSLSGDLMLFDNFVDSDGTVITISKDGCPNQVFVKNVVWFKT